MAAERKGQQVKTFKHYTPVEGEARRAEQIMKVYFKADNGQFYIYPDAFLMAFAHDGYDGPSGGYSLYNDRIAADTMDTVIDGFKTICQRYEHAMKENKKVKVIRFWFAKNIRQTLCADRDDMSFVGSPALHLRYEVLWRVGDVLLRENMQSAGKVGSTSRGDGTTTIIDWSEARELFFANMVAGLETLIMRCVDFTADLEKNVDNAIAHKQGLFLPAPENV